MPEFIFDAVLFDMDGVILDSMQQHAGLWQELLAGIGFEVPKRYILENEGSLGPEALLLYLQEQGLPTGEALNSLESMDQLLSRQASLYIKRHAKQVRPFPGAAPLLQALGRAGVPCALVTSSRRKVVQECLGNGLLTGFKALITADDVSRHKPDPEPYQKAAAALGKEPGRCLAVENAPAGIASALSAGATCYAVCSTLPADALNQAHQIYADLDQVAHGLGLGRESR